MNYFNVFIQDNADQFTEKSRALNAYNSPETSLELAASDKLCVGLDRPFSCFYLELVDKSTQELELTAEYFDGVDWKALPITDETQGLSQSGFVHFEKPEDFVAVDLNGKQAFYIRLIPSQATGVVSARYLDILFCGDSDLEGVKANVVSKFSVNGSWLEKNIAARDEIIQTLRNRGNVKRVKPENALLESDVIYKDITKFDFLEPLQLRNAAKYLSLYLIFSLELSDDPDDKWQVKANQMLGLYENAMEYAYTAIDKDEDGKKESGEVATSSSSVSSIQMGF